MTIPQVPMQLMVETKDSKADLYINGDITKGFTFLGWDMGQESDVSYSDVAEALNDLPSEVTDVYVHINSYGGEVAEGIAIYNALKSCPAKVTTVCEGFACSIASVIFMAGDVRVMREASLLMLHNASMSARGDSQVMRKAAEDLDIITDLSKTAYLAHATDALTREKLTEVMDVETWVPPETALEWGLCTEIDADEDEDSTTQSARHTVMSLLTGSATATAPVAELVATEDTRMDESFQQVFARLDDLMQLLQGSKPTESEDKDDEEDDPDEPDKDDSDSDDEDEDDPKQANPFAKYVAAFAAIANSK